MGKAGKGRPLTFPDMDRLSIDREDRLCLDGKPIVVKNVLFDSWQRTTLTICAVAMVLLKIWETFGMAP